MLIKSNWSKIVNLIDFYLLCYYKIDHSKIMVNPCGLALKLIIISFNSKLNMVCTSCYAHSLIQFQSDFIYLKLTNPPIWVFQILTSLQIKLIIQSISTHFIFREFFFIKIIILVILLFLEIRTIQCNILQ